VIVVLRFGVETREHRSFAPFDRAGRGTNPIGLARTENKADRVRCPEKLGSLLLGNTPTNTDGGLRVRF
jgi:hypothetical protein